MAEEVAKKAEAVAVEAEPSLASGPPPPATVKDPLPLPPGKVDDTKALAVSQKAPDPSVQKSSTGSHDRDVALAKVETEKRLSFIKAWEESEKTKAENKAQKKFSEVSSWENTKKAAIEAQLKKIEEQLEKKKADFAETMKNKIAEIHKQAEEKRAMVDARRQEEILKADEMSAKYRATNQIPKQVGCFGC